MKPTLLGGEKSLAGFDPKVRPKRIAVSSRANSTKALSLDVACSHCLRMGGSFNKAGGGLPGKRVISVMFLSFRRRESDDWSSGFQARWNDQRG